MSTILVILLGQGTCSVEHIVSGARIYTDTPPEYGGWGRSLSSTDLLTAALGSCIATSMESYARNHTIELSGICISVKKELSSAPKRVAKLKVEIRISQPIDCKLKEKLLHVAQTCPVHRSFNPEIETGITIVTD